MKLVMQESKHDTHSNATSAALIFLVLASRKLTKSHKDIVDQ